MPRQQQFKTVTVQCQDSNRCTVTVQGLDSNNWTVIVRGLNNNSSNINK